jgi:glycosyltransferase involved in cell wall biosynthesis
MLTPKVLFISDLFPNQAWPAFGIFIEHQAVHLSDYCDIVVVSPMRVFPHLRLLKQAIRPNRFISEFNRWIADLTKIPPNDIINGLPVYYPRYTSPPRQIFHATWGFFAYPFIYRLLKDLHLQHNFDLIHAHYATPAGVIALLAQRWLPVPLVLSIHGSDITYTAKQNLLSARIIHWILRGVDYIITNSTWTSNRIEHYGGMQNNVHIVQYGGNAPKNVPIFHKSSKDGVITLLSVGYLEERKGQAYVLHAVARLRKEGYNLHYVLVGNGSQREKLEALAIELGITDNVSFEGYKPHSEVWSYFASCDIFVLPSWNEAFGIVYIEAMGLGKPVIACEGEGGPEDLKALGDCIELVKPRDVDSLVRAIQSLIDNPNRRDQLATIGRKIVDEYYSWENNAKKTYQIYCEALENKHA